MTALRVFNETRAAALVESGSVADTAWKRMVGLLRHAGLEKGDGLLITPCNSIHSFWMKFRFDAVFIDRHNKVVHLIEDMAPGGISKIVFRAQSVLELPSGVIRETGTQNGDQLQILKTGA